MNLPHLNVNNSPSKGKHYEVEEQLSNNISSRTSMMSDDGESDWNKDPGLTNQNVYRCENLKGFYRPTISSKLKEYAPPYITCDKEQLNISNSAITSRCKQTKSGILKEFRSVKDHLVKRKQLLVKYRQSKNVHASEDDLQDFVELKSNHHGVRFTKLNETLNDRKLNSSLKCKSPNFGNNLGSDFVKNSKSLPRCLKLRKNCASGQLQKRMETSSREVKIDNKNNMQKTSPRKRDFGKNKDKSFASCKNESGWVFPIISTDKSKQKGFKNFRSNEISIEQEPELSSGNSEIDQLKDLTSSLNDISTASNLRDTDVSLADVSRSLKDIDKKIDNKQSSKSKVVSSFNKVFISRSQLNSRRRAVTNSEANPKNNFGKKKKAVEEWLSNHCLPICDSKFLPKSRSARISPLHVSTQATRKSSAEEQTEKYLLTSKENSVAEAAQTDQHEIKSSQITKEVAENTLTDTSQVIVPNKQISSDNAIKVAEKSTLTENPCQVDKIVGDEMEIDAIPENIEMKSDKISQINHTPVSSTNLDDDWGLQEKKITFSEVKNKVQPVGLQKSTQNRDRILKDVSQNVEDFQGKSITFSVVDFNTADKREHVFSKNRKVEDGSTNFPKESINETRESTQSFSFIQKFNEAIQQSYEENESNQAEFSGLKKKEHLVYDPEMLKCSPSSSQWSYAVDLVNSVLKQNLKSEVNQRNIPSYVSCACNRDCLLRQFHSNRISFSVEPGIGASLPNSNIKHRKNEFSVWKNNNNTHNEMKSMPDFLMRNEYKTLKPTKDSDISRSSLSNPEQSHLFQQHTWLGKYKDLAIRNNNFQKFNSVSRTQSNSILSPQQGFHQETFISPDASVEYDNQLHRRDCHTVYPLPIRVVEDMHGKFSDCNNNFDDEIVHNSLAYQNSPSSDWTTVLPLGTESNWNQGSICNCHSNKVPEAVNRENTTAYPANFVNVPFENNSENEKQNEFQKRKPKASNRIRFSVMGNTKCRMQVMKQLNCLPCYRDDSAMETEVENPRSSRTYDRLKIEHTSVSSSPSSISSANSKSNKYGFFNLESNVIGTVPTPANNFDQLPTCCVKHASSSMTLSTLKSGSEYSYNGGTFGMSQYYLDCQGHPLISNKSYQNFRRSTCDSSKFRIVSPP